MLAFLERMLLVSPQQQPEKAMVCLSRGRDQKECKESKAALRPWL